MGHPNLWRALIDSCAGAGAVGGADAPGHARGVVGEAVAAVGGEQDDAAVSAEAFVQVGDGFGSDLLRRPAQLDAIRGPLAQNQLHDGFAPAGERDGSALVVGIAAASDEGRVTDASGIFVERATGGGSG